MEQIDQRRSSTKERILKIQNLLTDAEQYLKGNACVYATGSFGRLEAGHNSDLDVFILALDRIDQNGKFEGSRLSGLDAICVKAELIKTTKELNIPEFDGDGRYLVHYCVNDFTGTLGTPEDDVTNTFTARLLLLLESYPLIGLDTYKIAVDQVLEVYFRDYPDHMSNFVPAFLGNDILRLWRTFCVNYEARTERAPEDKKRKGKVKNYKLKHSRLLTCYSSLLYIMAKFKINDTFSPNDAVEMVKLTPLQRLEWIFNNKDFETANAVIETLLSQYGKFLSTTLDDKALGDNLMSKTESHIYAESTYAFGDTMFEAMKQVGGETRLHRLLVV